MTATAAARENVAPSTFLPGVVRDLPATAARWVTGVWDALAGAWLAAAGEIELSRSNRFTLVAWALALAAALAAARALRNLPWRPLAPESGRRVAAVALAVAVGLLPVAFARRAPSLGPYESRFRTPIVAFAAVAVVALALRISAARYRKAVLLFLVFVAGFRVAAGAFEARRFQRFLEAVGAEVRPLVANSPGITVAVLPGQGSNDPADLTPKATMRWPVEDARRVWVMPPDEGEELFGPRTNCRDTDRIDTPPMLHSLGRRGAVSHLVWVPVEEGAPGPLEAYCVEPGGSAASASPR
jgi:hypothetical protein